VFTCFMHRFMIVAGIMLVLCGVTIAQDKAGGILKPDEDTKAIVKSINRFAFDIFKEAALSEDNTNALVSPYSISSALGMIFNGAAGATRDSIAGTLHYGDMPVKVINGSYKKLDQQVKSINSMISIETANSIWYADNFEIKKNFLDTNREYFGADILPADFADPEVCGQINDWIAGKTGNKIRNMLNCPIVPEVIMYLINAIYFKGVWKYQFDPNETVEMPFYLADGSRSTCDMMREKREYSYQANDDFQAIEIPYGNGRFAMSVFLPARGKSVDKFIAGLSYENWNKCRNGFAEDSVILWLPKFKVNYNILLNDALIALGMRNAFGGADFSGISKSARIFISRVLHNAFIQVDEQGTEAAAATVVELKKGPGQKNVMLVNRPFVYVIHDNQSGAILFIGKIDKPLWENG
jgi:serine protease inhibitor